VHPVLNFDLYSS